MSTMKGTLRRAILSGLVGALVALGSVSAARADVASDQPGAILIFPKIVVDTAGVLGPPTDTEIQITNTSNQVVSARCFYVDATSRCSLTDTLPCTPAAVADGSGPGSGGCPTGEVCTASWREIDFKMTLTKRQPVSWKASTGLSNFPCDGVSKFCKDNQSNRGSDGSPSAVPPLSDPAHPLDPAGTFVGELKCVQVDPSSFKPSTGSNATNGKVGDLKGEATLVATVRESGVDARKYNAIGIQSTGVNDGSDDLKIGGPGAEYNGCPNVLIMDHLFDGAPVVTHSGMDVDGSFVSTDLTVIPCSEDFKVQEANLGGATLQFLVFNEFEQRFSTSTRFTCFKEVQLSDIDTRPGEAGNAQSIFNVAVQGTLAGQTRIRPVEGATLLNGVLGVTEEFWSCDGGAGGQCSDASNLHFTGTRTDKGDVITLSPELP